MFFFLRDIQHNVTCLHVVTETERWVKELPECHRRSTSPQHGSRIRYQSPSLPYPPRCRQFLYDTIEPQKKRVRSVSRKNSSLLVIRSKSSSTYIEDVCLQCHKVTISRFYRAEALAAGQTDRKKTAQISHTNCEHKHTQAYKKKKLIRHRFLPSWTSRRPESFGCSDGKVKKKTFFSPFHPRPTEQAGKNE